MVTKPPPAQRFGPCHGSRAPSPRANGHRHATVLVSGHNRGDTTMRIHEMHWPSLVLALAICTACDRGDDADTVRIDPPPGALGVEDQQPLTPGFNLLQQAPFQPGPAAAGRTIVGRATLMSPSAEAGTPEGIQLEVRMENLEPDTDYGWHVFMGRCDEPGTLTVGVSPGAAGLSPGSQTEAVAQPLRVAAGGIASQTAVLPTAQLTPQQLPLRPYSVRVYEGLAPEPARLLACADIGSTGDPATP
jgi:hypothetical protein